MQRRVPDTGPLLPGEASTIITAVAWLIGLGGVLTLLGVAVVILTSMLGTTSVPMSIATVIGLAVVAGLGFAYCVTGVWLHQGRRRGAYLAMGALGLNLLQLLLGSGRPSAMSVLVPVAGLVGVALAWPHLSDAGRRIDEQVSVTPRTGSR